MASQYIESIHSCLFQLNTQSSSTRRQSEESRRNITRACRLPLIPSKKKFMIDVPSVCSNQKSQDPSRKLQARSMLISSSLSAPADRFSPPPPSGEKLDQWMKQSIIEIVNHIQDAPFVHYVFDKTSPLSRRWQKVPATYISQERGGAEERWGILRNDIAHICPDGIIYVQKLNSECKCKYCSAHGYSRRGSGGEQEEGSTDMWGLIVQGRGGGVSCCASYILKTTRFVSANGCWTQFSLVKAKCFGECPCTQFIRSWLFQSQQV
eukprot:PITA_27914